MLKRLFHASASILMLALAYHIGARSATAQSQPAVAEIDGMPQEGAFAAVLNRVVYRIVDGSSSPMPPVPGTSPIIAVCGTRGAVMLGSGDICVYDNNAWRMAGNVFKGPTPGSGPNWGQLKPQYLK